MTKTEAVQSIKKLNAEAMSLQPTAIISFFEIDATNIAEDMGYSNYYTVFRFHNTLNLINNDIYWQGIKYIGAPIKAEGFEMATKGTAATPTLSISVSTEGVTALAQLKALLRNIGDLVGAKLTRKRTFAKYIDEINFLENKTPVGFDPDPTVEFPNDIFYVTRKSAENKYTIQYELGSILDLQDLKLPNRFVSSSRCMWQYRGAGCLYECRANYNSFVYEGCDPNYLKETVEAVAPIANSLDEPITGIINQQTLTPSGKFNYDTVYQKGDYVYLTKNGLNYYYVAKQQAINISPPNSEYWIEDQCSKTTIGCRLRHLKNSNTILPFGGFITVNKYG